MDATPSSTDSSSPFLPCFGLWSVAGIGAVLHLATYSSLFGGPHYLQVVSIGSAVATLASVTCVVYGRLTQADFTVPKWMEPMFPVRGRWLRLAVAAFFTTLFLGFIEALLFCGGMTPAPMIIFMCW